MTSTTTFDRVGSLSPRDAAAEALARLLKERLEARVYGGTAPDRAVKLEAVFSDWPDPRRLCTPCASIADVVLSDDDANPIDLDEVFDEDAGLAARVSEASGELAVDLWATDREERRALKAAFRALFRMGTSRGGLAVLVPLPVDAIPPALRRKGAEFVVRLSLAEPPRNLGDSEGAIRDEWRAQARVSWDAELVTGADAVRLDAVVFDVDVVPAMRDAMSPEND